MHPLKIQSFWIFRKCIFDLKYKDPNYICHVLYLQIVAFVVEHGKTLQTVSLVSLTHSFPLPYIFPLRGFWVRVDKVGISKHPKHPYACMYTTPPPGKKNEETTRVSSGYSRLLVGVAYTTLVWHGNRKMGKRVALPVRVLLSIFYTSYFFPNCVHVEGIEPG